MNSDELAKYAQENGERFWKDAGNHWLNDSLDLMANARVVEVGGYLGNWTDYVQERYSCFVDVYEPVQEYYEHLFQRFSNRPKIEVFNSAVEAYDGTTHIAVMDEGSSLYNGGFSSGPVVSVVDIEGIVRRTGKVDLLAINGEGCEYNIIDHLIETGEIINVNQLLVQFHAFYPDAENRRATIRERLAKTHWEKMYYPFCWESWRRQGWDWELKAPRSSNTQRV